MMTPIAADPEGRRLDDDRDREPFLSDTGHPVVWPLKTVRRSSPSDLGWTIVFQGQYRGGASRRTSSKPTRL